MMQRDTLVAIGGKYWRDNQESLYFEGLHQLEKLNFQVVYDSAGSVNEAILNGEVIPKQEARRLLSELSRAYIWYHFENDEFTYEGLDEAIAQQIIKRLRQQAAAMEDVLKKFNFWLEKRLQILTEGSKKKGASPKELADIERMQNRMLALAKEKNVKWLMEFSKENPKVRREKMMQALYQEAKRTL
ncbi:hypothetical protein SAMN05421831_10128 [Allopseudospirillum japonicum]|uniref:Uncharacterized protein n=1 Tax=Allopseudospirillum japonicum TaxID=64971 RepID=A0A1H6Q653_9GAMM|nr:hypothetical protein [Allopseudospirillum japonicum]SEI37366.1 hypothetical protein SAMN05421831_10128 [Allopseudospirillum japonicum]